MDKSLEQAIVAIKAGDKATARKLLLAIIKENPNNETAILWLSTTTDDPARKRECFERVLKINPENEVAKRGLDKLDRADSTTPQAQAKRKIQVPL